METATTRFVLKCTTRPQDDAALAVNTSEALSIKDLKHELFRSYPFKWPRIRFNTKNVRIIFMGKELSDEELLEAVRSKSKAQPIVLHCVLVERSPDSPSTPTMPARERLGSPNVRRSPLFPELEETPQDAPEDVGEEQEAHFHAVTVSEKELSEFRQIFDKKKGSDGLISLSNVKKVLQSYWAFIHREGFEENPGPFPEQRLEKLRQKLQGGQSGLTLDQFLCVFYLFDNVAAEEPCVHGEKSRVRIATEQLHAAIQQNGEFDEAKFEKLFSIICSDENQVLTCKEMELLYYMYSAHVLEQIREAQLVAKVQAIVRMKQQSQRYEKLVDAARTVQNAWRMRLFAADRRNHERIADFLKCLMATQSPLKGPRF